MNHGASNTTPTPPTGLIEAGVAKWTVLEHYLTGPIYFTHVNQVEGGGEAAGKGIREPRRGERITTNMGRFVPHLFE